MAIELTTENYGEVAASKLPVLIDFGAEWCGPCRMVAPIVEELAGEYEGRVLICTCDAEKSDDIVATSCPSFRKTSVGMLRTPSEREHDEFLRRPHVYGVPILFPPNRIADGRFRFDGREYRFPITRPEENNYHHGILKSQSFAVSKAVETPDEVLIETRCYSNAASDAIYRDFPHAFKCKITYRLSAEGLEQEVMFGNKSDLPMPVGVGFHTPLNVPFAGGDAADYRLRMAVGERFELNGRNLPTGRLLPLDERFARLRAPEGLQATGCEAIEAGFSVREIEVDGRPFRGAVVENRRTGVRVFYEVDSQTLYWTLWNNGGQVPYCCPEPQSWATDAPNLPDRERWGFRSIPPGGKWSIRYRLYVK